MTTVIVGTLNVQSVENAIQQELAMVTNTIKQLVNARPFGMHTDQDIKDYMDLRRQQENLKLQIL
jgi:hypothetical protein